MQKSVSAICLALLLAGCGSTVEQRAATGGLTGAGVGAVIGGPAGALIGGAAGATGGAITPVPADELAAKGTKELKSVTPSFLGGKKKSSRSAERSAPARYSDTRIASNTETVKRAQTTLQHANFYNGPIDGIVGKKTHRALLDYQKSKGIRQTGGLNEETLKSLTSEQQ